MNIFEWDEQKDESNFRKHGIRFDEAVRIFLNPVLTQIDDKTDYGELRESSIGLLDGAVVLVVIHTDRDGSTRLISARRANRSEKREFNDYYQKNAGRDSG